MILQEGNRKVKGKFRKKSGGKKEEEGGLYSQG